MVPPPPRSTLFPHDALPISLSHHALRLAHHDRRRSAHHLAAGHRSRHKLVPTTPDKPDRRRHHLADNRRSEEHTSELQSHSELVCRLLPEKKNGDPPAGERT